MAYEALEMDGLLEALGFEQPGGRHPYLISCPFHPEDTPSCAIYFDGFFCFGCSKGGDGIQFLREMGLGWGKIVAYLEGLGIDATADRPPRKEPEIIDMTDTFRRESTFKGLPDAERLVQEKWPHLSLRWLQTKAGVGVGDYNLLIPHHDLQGRIVGIKTRSLLPARLGAKAAYPGSTFTSSLYSATKEAGASDCWLVEGESDCFTLTHFFGHSTNPPQVYGLPCGVQTWRDEWLEQLKGFKRIHVWFDGDDPGRSAQTRVLRKIQESGIVDYTSWGSMEDGEDVTSAYLKGWRP